MKTLCSVVLIAAVSISLPLAALSASQEAKPAPKARDAAASKPASPAPSTAAPDAKGKEYSGMYTFLKEGEFVQVTVEDAGQVTGFISRYRDSSSGKSDFVDQFFKSGKLDGNKLSFMTNPVSSSWYEFKGAVERGGGKTPEEEAYYVLRGTLTENTTGTDKDKKVTSRAQDVAFKMFPQDAEKDAEKVPDAKNY
jgi:hypothetical protein